MHAPGAHTADQAFAQSTSALLLSAVRGQDDRVTIGEILDALDARAFGLATLLFAIPSCVPMPPGVPTIVGFALLIVSSQMVLGRQELWLPGFITRRSFSREALLKGLQQFTPILRAIERVARPRLRIMTGGPGTVLAGVLILAMAIILILPLPPGGNFPFAVVCAIIGLGLAERDGLIVLIGALASFAAVAAGWFLTTAVIDAVPAITRSFTQAWSWLVAAVAG
jgi:hypothetical protein